MDVPDGVGDAVAEQASPEPARKKDVLFLAGFLARGNAGDEAMFQCIVEAFSPLFDIVASVDLHGAFHGFREWYPYSQVKIIHQMEIGEIFARNGGAGMLIGGGGLPIGFAGSQMLVAKCKRRPVIMAGVDLWNHNPRVNPIAFETVRQWYGMFSHIVPRTEASVGYAREYGIAPIYGADWALNLEMDRSTDIEFEPRRAVVVVREDSPSNLPANFMPDVHAILDALEARGWNPVILPFSPEDVRFLDAVGLRDRAPVETCWWNARRLKQFIGSSGLMVSVNRLHPMIFAAPLGRPVATVVPDGTGPILKISQMGQELGADVFNGVAGFLEALRDNRIRPADPARVTAAQRRLEKSIGFMRDAFLAR